VMTGSCSWIGSSVHRGSCIGGSPLPT